MVIVYITAAHWEDVLCYHASGQLLYPFRKPGSLLQGVIVCSTLALKNPIGYIIILSDSFYLEVFCFNNLLLRAHIFDVIGVHAQNELYAPL